MEQSIVGALVIGSFAYVLCLYTSKAQRKNPEDSSYILDPTDVKSLVTKDGTYIEPSSNESYIDLQNRLLRSKQRDWAEMFDPFATVYPMFNPKPREASEASEHLGRPLYNNTNELV